MAAKQNSLVGNINRKKRAGTSRPKSRSSVSPEAYAEMQAGWPRKKRKAKKKRSAARKRAGKAKKAR